jgi:hypothetical protein
MGYYYQAFFLSVFLNSILISAILFTWFRTRALSPTNADSAISLSPTNTDSAISNAVDASHFGSHSAGEMPTDFRVYGSANRDQEKPKQHVVDEAYVRIYQRYNKKLYRWEEFTPSTRESLPAPQDKLIFVVYYRYSEPTAIREFETLVEVKSETLIAVLRRCMKIVDSKIVPTGYGQHYGDTSDNRDRVQVAPLAEKY